MLNDPEERLDAAPQFLPWNNGGNAFRLGGEWEIFIQAVEPGDRGGTACWMGQNYGNLPWLHDEDLSYSDTVWLAEVDRLNRDPEHHHRFRAGDLVEVTAARSLFYAGKRNINEAHDTQPSADFVIRLLHAGYGLPEPEVITLSDLTRPDDGDPQTSEAIFDATRSSGCEYYQGMRVRITGLRLVDDSGWGQTAWGDRLCIVRDGTGRHFTLRMPLTDLGPAPEEAIVFDAVGILDQDSGSSQDGTTGYNLFVQEIYVDEAPRLSIEQPLVLSWRQPAEAFVLEQALNLGGVPTHWTTVTNATLVTSGADVLAILDRPSEPRFYRLRLEGHP
jgi:hypothetical protein